MYRRGDRSTLARELEFRGGELLCRRIWFIDFVELLYFAGDFDFVRARFMTGLRENFLHFTRNDPYGDLDLCFGDLGGGDRVYFIGTGDLDTVLRGLGDRLYGDVLRFLDPDRRILERDDNGGGGGGDSDHRLLSS